MRFIYLSLLFFPSIMFSQSQLLNGIELNGPKGFVKSGDLMWSKGNSNIIVQSIGFTQSIDDFQNNCRRGSRSSQFVETDLIEINGKNYPYCIQKGDNGSMVLQTMVYRDNYTYLIFLSDNSSSLDETMEQLGYMLGYMVVRVEQF